MNSSSPGKVWSTVNFWRGEWLGQYWSYIGLGWKCAWIYYILGWVGSIIDWVAGNLWQSGSGQYGRRHQTLVQSSRAAQKILHHLSSPVAHTLDNFSIMGCRVQTVILSREQIHCTQYTALWQDNDQSAYRSKESFCESSVLQNFISTKQKVTSQWELKNSLKTVKECLWFSLQRDRTLRVVRT